MIEFGCGDGNQLSLAEYPSYIGLDVSRTAIGLCQRRFSGDPAKSFFLYDGTCFTDRAGVFAADLALSLDVVYHLTEDAVFETYLRHLFAAGAAAGRHLLHERGTGRDRAARTAPALHAVGRGALPGLDADGGHARGRTPARPGPTSSSTKRS